MKDITHMKKKIKGSERMENYGFTEHFIPVKNEKNI